MCRICVVLLLLRRRKRVDRVRCDCHGDYFFCEVVLVGRTLSLRLVFRSVCFLIENKCLTGSEKLVKLSRAMWLRPR